jgi:AhpD family alkylhydroperoxidase
VTTEPDDCDVRQWDQPIFGRCPADAGVRFENGIRTHQEQSMDHAMYPATTRELHQKRRELAPDAYAAFRAFSQAVFADGALPAKTKQLIAVAVAHVTQCPYCIRGHTEAALGAGASEPELMEAIWVAAEMRAGAAYAHATLALDTMHDVAARRAGDRTQA